ncbi:MAG: type II toxin-antitoxin system VapC family toxin [Chthoniobacterales bacterium]
MLLDSNILIYASNGSSPQAVELLAVDDHAVASITLIEFYGCKDLAPEERKALDTVFARLTAYELYREVIDEAIRLRQARKIRLGDSIIAATALCHGLCLATNNTADFTGIPGLELFNPLSK